MAFSLHVKPFVPRWRPAEARAGKGPQLASSQRLPARKPGRMESARRRHSSSPVSTCSPNRTLKRGTRGDSHPAPRLSLSDPGLLTRGDPRAAPLPRRPGKVHRRTGEARRDAVWGRPTPTFFPPHPPPRPSLTHPWRRVRLRCGPSGAQAAGAARGQGLRAPPLLRAPRRVTASPLPASPAPGAPGSAATAQTPPSSHLRRG